MPAKASKPAAKEAPKEAKTQNKPKAAAAKPAAAKKDTPAPKAAAAKPKAAEGKKKEAAPAKQAPKAKAAPTKGKDSGKAAKAAPQAAAAKKAPAKAKATPKRVFPGVYVKNLDFDGMSEQTVADAFRQSCGKVHQVRLRHGKYCLVFFESPAAQKKALELNGRNMKGKKIVVESAKKAKAEPDRATYCKTVYVGQLPGGCTAKQLRAHFKGCGKISIVRLYAQHYAFVYFQDVPSAKKAVALQQKQFFGRHLSIKLSVRTREMDKKACRATKARLLRLKLIQEFRKRQAKAMGLKKKAARRASSKKA